MCLSNSTECTLHLKQVDCTGDGGTGAQACSLRVGSESSSKSPSSKARPLFTLFFHQTCLPLTKAMNHLHPLCPPPVPYALTCVGDRLISTAVQVTEAKGSLTEQTHTASSKVPQ